jgi:metal-responsive CopG/Arc/MetJ family transcriptional regulator
MSYINEKVLGRVDTYRKETGETRDEIMENAITYYLDKKAAD